MWFLRHAPSRRVILGVVAGVGAGALGAGLFAADLFHIADQRRGREIAALQDEVKDQAAQTAQDRATVESLRADLARTTAEAGAVADLQQRLQQLAAERDAALALADDERVQLRAERDAAVERAAAEEARLAGEVATALERAAQERDRAVAERDAVMADARTVLGDLDAETRKTVADVERIIVATGLAGGRLTPEPNRIRRIGARGGPYIPWKEQVALADHAQGAQLHAMTQQLDRLKALRDVMVRLPLIAPVTHAILSDGFGYRWDPINGRGARHEGIDLRAVQASAIYAPAAGTVVLAGWDGAYGYTIEIDHGLGVTTRYSHLSRMLVRKGEVVAPREHIGVVGATGRATGTHLHYEIRLDGQPLNPMRFLGAVHAGEAFSGFVAR